MKYNARITRYTLWGILALSATLLAAVAITRLGHVSVEEEDIAMFI